MPAADAPATANHDIERRIARRLARLRAERGWSLEALAERTGISRPTLSRLERSELSPTAAMLGTLCSVYGWTLSRLMAEAETRAPNLVPAADQAEWTDPESGYRRRAVSAPAPGLRGELVEVHVPAGASVSFDAAPIAGLEHHLWMLDGALTLEGHRLPAACGRLSTLRPERADAISEYWQARRPLHHRDGTPMSDALHTFAGAGIEEWRPEPPSTSLDQDIDMLADVLHAVVHDGAGVSFIVPFTHADSRAFWIDKILPGVRAGTRRVLVARRERRIVGTVQLDLAMPPNQQHRAEVVKLLVHPAARRRGIARALMIALEPIARAEGRTLLTLDTWTGGSAEQLYLSLGYAVVGVIPRYARGSLTPELEPATIMYKELA
jgi:transcriptional regulator with XRE-family HTH domain/GNAT superfamily N-acetyltransferase